MPYVLIFNEILRTKIDLGSSKEHKVCTKQFLVCPNQVHDRGPNRLTGFDLELNSLLLPIVQAFLSMIRPTCLDYYAFLQTPTGTINTK